MPKPSDFFKPVARSKFLRSVFLRGVSIVLIVGIAIIVVAVLSFTSQMRAGIIAEKQRQLTLTEETISKRMREVSAIAYQIGQDSSIYLQPVSGVRATGYDISATLKRYLTGNGFIEYLAYHRLSEPDKLYTARGELSFESFYVTYLGLDKQTARATIAQVQQITKPCIILSYFGADRSGMFVYAFPLPQLSVKPQAFVLMMIPLSEVSPLFEAQLANADGVMAVFDADGNDIYRVATPGVALPDSLLLPKSFEEETYASYDGGDYVIARRQSDVNGWTFVSAIRLSNIIAGLNDRQLLLVVLLLLLMLLAVIAVVVSVAAKFKPISMLASSVTDRADNAAVIDEGSLLSDTLTALKDDSAQKKRFEQAYYDAEAANRAKSAFLSGVSHDIRTPMNAIVGMTELALKHPDNPAYVRQCLEKARVSSRYLLDIINNVLDMSRIESGRFTLSQEPVDLCALLHELLNILNQSASMKKLRLVCQTEAVANERVLGDGVRLMQLLMNIASNAVKFTPEGGTVRLRLGQEGADADGFGTYVFSCSDTGIGMTPEFVAHVFDTFSRASEVDAAHTEGSGLGMAIAKNLVELMGGSITCQSELGEGTTFTVRLRLKLDGAQDAREDAQTVPPARVLLVCHDDDERARITWAFEHAGVLVTGVKTPSEAAEHAERACPEGGYALVALCHTQAQPVTTQDIPRIASALGRERTRYVILSLDLTELSQVGASAYGADALYALPLFASMARKMTLRTSGDEDAQSGQRAPVLTGRHILVAEDNDINLEIACALLSETGAEVVTALNGREAVDAFESRPEGYFDLILMDLQMPVMDGREAARAIRACSRGDAKTVRIYAMTASTFAQDVRLVQQAGMDGHLGKPYTAQALYAVLREALHA